jgi:hypothetical protein
MKAKKALKRLRRVEALLSIVIDQFAGNERSVRDLLDSAKTSVIRAKAGINSQSAPRTAKKPQLKAKQTKPSHLTAKDRKRISLAGKKRPAAAKGSWERKAGTPVKSALERDTTKSGSPTPPGAKPADRAQAPEASPEPDQEPLRAN